MEKITVREFRAKIGEYLARIRAGERFIINGMILGRIVEDKGRVHGDSGLAVEVSTERVHGEEQKEEQERVHEEEGAEINQCDKCGKSSPDSYEVWEDGDEYIICSNCVKIGIPPKMLKGYLAKLKKL